MRKLMTAVAGAAALFAGALSGQAEAQADKDLTIALIPGLTTDAFYITMHRGAQHAADSLGVELLFQGAPEFNATLQVPVLDAVIARGPDAILIAPTDKVQLIEPLRRANDAGIPIITVDTFIDDGNYQDGSGDGDFPLSYIASDNVLGGQIAARALAEAIGGGGHRLRVQRQAGHLDYRPARGRLQAGDGELSRHHRAGDPVQRRRRQQGGVSVAGRRGPQSGSGGRLRRQPVSPPSAAANGVRAVGKSGEIRVVAFDAPQSIVDDIGEGLVDMTIAQHPAEIGYYGVMSAYAHLTGQSLPIAIGTGFTVIDASNMNDPEIVKFIYSE